MTTTARNVLLFGPLLAVWAVVLLVAARKARPAVLHAPATQAIPAGALAVATIDLVALRGTRLRGLLGGRSERWLGADLPRVCGSDPFAGAVEVAVAMPAAPGDGEFGVAVAGELNAEALVVCATRVVRQRGGHPVALRQGAFVVVTDVASSSEGQVAVRPGGPLLFGGAEYVHRMMATVEGREPSVESDARHVALRSEAGAGALVASLLLSADLRERMAQGLGEPGAGAAGVMGVGLSVGASDPVAVRLVVGCDRAATCSGASSWLRSVAEREGEGLLGAMREPLRRARVSSEGPIARVETALPAGMLEALVEGLLP